MTKSIVPAKLNESNDKLILLDQRLLPEQEKYLKLDQREDIWEAIKNLKVRGAPAIGIAAAYGLYVCLNKYEADSTADLRQELEEIRDYLAAARPTAVNLFWALKRMKKRFDLEIEKGKNVEEIKAALLDESDKILKEDQKMDLAIGENALSLLEPGMGLLTHCNAGGLATSGYGTASAPMYLGHDRGYDFKIYADETRPLLQGSRITAFELDKAGLDVTVITDNMAAQVMKEGKIDAVLVGSDRIAANGDAANKIGTLGVAVLAKEFGIPVYFLAPTSTIDLEAKSGADIEIELRDPEEIKNGFGRRTAPETVKAYNPAFDVTPASYITAIITEKGVITPPFKEKIKKLFND